MKNYEKFFILALNLEKTKKGRKNMTNADKYLKDGVDVEEFIGEFNDFISKQTESQSACVRLAQFLKYPAKPTLSEDEKVILRNINKDIYTIIGFDIHGLYLRSDNPNTCKEYSFYDMFNSLFQFIYDGEEYKISDLLGDEK